MPSRDRIRRGRRRSLAALALLAALPSAGSAAPRIELRAGEFVVEDPPPGARAEQLQVRVEGAARPMLGTPSRDNGADGDGERLRFRPRFPLQPGVRYRVELAGETPLVAHFLIPPPAREVRTRVDAVYPSGPAVPANLLKLYIQFSQPVSRGEAYARVALLDTSGRAVESPFVQIEPELWDPSGTRLTLLFDPGRIKRGLLPNREVGPPLRAGERYTLVVSREWVDAGGAPLEAEYRQPLQVVADDREPPDPARWGLIPPAAQSRDALALELDEPLDHALLSDAVGVWSAAGDPVAGSIEISSGETRWRFTPDAPWTPGEYRLRGSARLEDLAGNRIGRAFDVDLSGGEESPAPRSLEIPFAVR